MFLHHICTAPATDPPVSSITVRISDLDLFSAGFTVVFGYFIQLKCTCEFTMNTSIVVRGYKVLGQNINNNNNSCHVTLCLTSPLLDRQHD